MEEVGNPNVIQAQLDNNLSIFCDDHLQVECVFLLSLRSISPHCWSVYPTAFLFVRIASFHLCLSAKGKTLMPKSGTSSLNQDYLTELKVATLNLWVNANPPIERRRSLVLQMPPCQFYTHQRMKTVILLLVVETYGKRFTCLTFILSNIPMR